MFLKSIPIAFIFLKITIINSFAQEIGEKYLGGIVIAPGIIMHPSRIEIKSTGINEFTYQEALNICKNLRTGGYSDWHVPTISDLENINRYAQDNLTWDNSYPYPLFPGRTYISSSTKKNDNLFSSTTYRYFYYMIKDKQTINLGPQKEIRDIEWNSKGLLIPVRYFR